MWIQRVQVKRYNPVVTTHQWFFDIGTDDRFHLYRYQSLVSVVVFEFLVPSEVVDDGFPILHHSKGIIVITLCIVTHCLNEFDQSKFLFQFFNQYRHPEHYTPRTLHSFDDTMYEDFHTHCNRLLLPSSTFAM